MSQPRSLVTDPQVEIQLEGEPERYQPHDFLTCEYRVRLEPDQSLTALEASVLWVTEGKGQEDLGVHFFERRGPDRLSPEILAHPQRLGTVLPSTPLSYRGNILRIRWCVRIRLFLGGGRETIVERAFQLVDRPSACPQE